MHASTASKWFTLSWFLAASFAAAAIGGIANASSLRDWYPFIEKPSWTPPDAVFGPVWTVLYCTMAIAAWRVWQRAPRSSALSLFYVQLALNALWSVIFFGMRLPGVAFAEVVALWVFIALTAAAFWRVDRAAGTLLIPYLAWVSFAAALNFAIWQLNA